MPLPTARVPGELVSSADINAIAQGVNDLEVAVNAKAPTVHTHDDRYFTEGEVTTLLAGKSSTSHTHTAAQVGAAPASHTHDDRYFTETEVNNLLSGKAAVAHQHYAGDTVDLTEAVQDILNTTVVAGSNITKTYDDAAGTLTLSSTGGTGGGGDPYMPLETRPGSNYTIVATDVGKMLSFNNASAITITVPWLVLAAGDRVEILRRGSAAINLVGSNVTLRGLSAIDKQWKSVTLIAVSSTEVVVLGDEVGSAGGGGVGFPWPVHTHESSAWWTGPIMHTSGSGWGKTLGQIWFQPLPIGRPTRITAFRVGVMIVGDGLQHLGVYQPTPGSETPLNGRGELLAGLGTVGMDSLGVKTITGLSVDLTPGLYWLAALQVGTVEGQLNSTLDHSWNYMFMPRRNDGRTGPLGGETGASSLPAVTGSGDTWNQTGAGWYSMQTEPIT